MSSCGARPDAEVEAAVPREPLEFACLGECGKPYLCRRASTWSRPVRAGAVSELFWRMRLRGDSLEAAAGVNKPDVAGEETLVDGGAAAGKPAVELAEAAKDEAKTADEVACSEQLRCVTTRSKCLSRPAVT
mmetsp:Transcript_92449/g.169625  ORF Transcript_92449/g.169625 Transcript_92449/m.169625 type:complete len:132 (-) Transcript_92449:1334-1729(-)